MVPGAVMALQDKYHKMSWYYALGLPVVINFIWFLYFVPIRTPFLSNLYSASAPTTTDMPTAPTVDQTSIFTTKPEGTTVTSAASDRLPSTTQPKQGSSNIASISLHHIQKSKREIMLVVMNLIWF